MRAEIAKVKKEIDSYAHSISKIKRLKKLKGVKTSEDDLETKLASAPSISETSAKSTNEEISSAERQSLLLRKIFGNNVNM